MQFRASAVTTVKARAPQASHGPSAQSTQFSFPELLAKGSIMRWTICVMLLVLWLLGVVSSYTLGGFIHVLLVVVIVVAWIQLIQGRRAV
jgi:hypothetical protein